jgi:hypothetical protein
MAQTLQQLLGFGLQVADIFIFHQTIKNKLLHRAPPKAGV